MKCFLLASFILLLPIALLAIDITDNETPNWLTTSGRENTFPTKEYFVAFEHKKGIKSRDQETAKTAMSQDLKVLLTQRIYSAVTSLAEHSLREVDQRITSETYKKETRIYSQIDIFDGQPMWYYDKKQQTLYGCLAVNKAEMGQKHILSLQSKLFVLDSELLTHNPSISATLLEKNITNYNARLESMDNQAQIIIATGQTLPNDFSYLFASIREKINGLQKLMYSTALEEQVLLAQNYLASGQNELALDAFKVAEMQHPNDSRIIFGITEAKKRIEADFINRIHQYNNKLQYTQALDLYEKMFGRIPESRTKYQGDYQKLQLLAFDSYTEAMDYALKHQTIHDIRTAFANLEKYQYINRDKFRKYAEKANVAMAEDYYKQAKISFNQGNMGDAISYCNQAIYIDNKNDNYLDLKKKAQAKIIQTNTAELKLERPFLYCFQWGVGSQNQNNLFQQYLETDTWPLHMIPSISTGFYRKMGIRENVQTNGRDMSTSSLWGFRYTLLFNQYYYNTTLGELADTSLTALHELDWVIGLGHKFTLNIGVATHQAYKDVQLKTLNYTIFSLNRRLYMQPIEMDIEFKAYTPDFKEFFPIIRVGLLVNHNFVRKFNHNDRERLRYEVEQKYR